jgi:hypothetical protein
MSLTTHIISRKYSIHFPGDITLLIDMLSALYTKPKTSQ